MKRLWISIFLLCLVAVVWIWGCNQNDTGPAIPPTDDTVHGDDTGNQADDTQDCCLSGDPCHLANNGLCECPAQFWDQEDCLGVDDDVDDDAIDDAVDDDASISGP